MSSAVPLTQSTLERAIASYERTQFSFDSPFDHFMAGDANAISDSAKRGWLLFNTKARCDKCRALSEEKRDSTYFMDKDFHNIGTGIIQHNVAGMACQAEQEINSGNLIDVDRAAIQSDMSVLGRFLVKKKEADVASFKTPGLRNVLITAPYFHDGSQETLWDGSITTTKARVSTIPGSTKICSRWLLSNRKSMTSLHSSHRSPTRSKVQRNPRANVRCPAAAGRSATPLAPSRRNRFSPNHPVIVRLHKRSQKRNDPARCSARLSTHLGHFPNKENSEVGRTDTRNQVPVAGTFSS